ncbi:hypothetical protein DIPPA_27562 [Diplonema papillatum]|nr:hypothetical protein DIPPA_27562 [Diplonema papillatum]
MKRAQVIDSDDDTPLAQKPREAGPGAKKARRAVAVDSSSSAETSSSGSESDSS